MADSVDFVTAAECTGTAYADCLWQCGGMDGGFCVITALWGLYAAQRVDREKQKQKKKLSVWTMRYGQHVIKAGFTGIVVLAVLVCTKNVGGTESIHPRKKTAGFNDYTGRYYR